MRSGKKATRIDCCCSIVVYHFFAIVGICFIYLLIIMFWIEVGSGSRN